MENKIYKASATYDIEKSIIVSVIENSFIGNDNRIVDVSLNSSYFNDSFHKLIVNAINRLKELGEPIDSDFIRLKFIEVKKWNTDYDNKLIEIMYHNPIGTLDLFNSYYSKLKKLNNSKVAMI